MIAQTTPEAQTHPDDIAVDQFATAMKAKLAKKRSQGRGGWDDPTECTIADLSYMLMQHVWKGDPVDVGNLAMMIQQRGGRVEIDDDTRRIRPRLGEQSVAFAAVAPSPESTDLQEHHGNVQKLAHSVDGLWPDRPVLSLGSEERPAARPVDTGCLTISHLQKAHRLRQDEWCPDQKPDLSFRGNEMAGEVGEACNVVKKLERERHGWRGSRASIDDLGDELADVIHTAILCAITAGIDLEPRVVAKFNATSDKNGLSVRLDEVKR